MKNAILILATLITFVKTTTGQTWQWVREENAAAEGYGVCCDNLGNVFLTGYGGGSCSVGTYTHMFPGGGGIIAKYDADGNVLWADFMNGGIALNVACDATGNAFLCGYFSNTLSIGTQTFSGQGVDFFLAKYSPGGTVQWATTLGGAGTDVANAVSVDTQGDVIISGYVNGVSTFTMGSSVVTNTAAGKYLVAKCSNAGTPLWGICGAMGSSSSNYVCTDASDNIYLTGSYSGTSTIGSQTLVSAGSSDFFLAKFSAPGNPVWSVSGGGTGSDWGYCVKTHPSGDVVVTGAFSNTFALASASFTSAGSSDAFIARFDSNGLYQWALNGGGTGYDAGYSLATHPGGVYFSGSVGTPPFVIGTVTLTPPPSTSDNMFLCGINNSGSITYAQYINGGGDDVMALAMYNGCELFLGGDILTPTLTLGAYTLTHTASEVLFIAKFNTGINSPTLNLSPTYTLCQGNTLTLTASGANTYTWDNGPNTGTFVVSPVTTTYYVVAGTSTAGCSTKSVVNVVIAPNNVVFSAITGSPFCTGNTATLSVSGANTSNWSNGAFSPTISVSPSVTSVYNVTGISSTGCSYSSSYTLAVIPSTPITAVANHTSICKGSSATFTAAGANLYSWSTGPKQAIITVTPALTSTFAVTGTNTSNGCVSTVSLQLKVINCASIDETDNDAFLLVYPNPSRGQLYVQTCKDLQDANLQLTTLDGKLLYAGEIRNYEEEIRLELRPGIYIISIERSGIKLAVKKIIVE